MKEIKTVAFHVFENPKRNRTEGYDNIAKQAQIAPKTQENTKYYSISELILFLFFTKGKDEGEFFCIFSFLVFSDRDEKPPMSG